MNSLYKNFQINKNILICTSIIYYSRKDEDAFFEWIKKIDCIDDISGEGENLYLHIAADDIHDHDLRDLLALFYRYNVEMSQLVRFLTKTNKSWFYDNKTAFWHKKVFVEDREQ